MPYTKEEHQDVASKMERDEHGHFNKKAEESSNPSSSSSPRRSSSEGGSKPSDPSRLAFLKSIFPTGTSFTKDADEDTLIDVHVNNPLKRIVDLLQDIKRQKVFSFSLKGSLGLAGVALVLTGIGVFGGSQAFCTKGIQSHIGTIKVLQTQEEVTQSSIPIVSQIPLISQIAQKVLPSQTISRNRVILVKSDNTTIHLIPSRNFSLAEFTNLPVIATGDYNSCSQTLSLKDKNDIEIFR